MPNGKSNRVLDDKVMKENQDDFKNWLREDIKKVEEKIDHIILQSIPRIYSKMEELGIRVGSLEKIMGNNGHNDTWVLRNSFKIIGALISIIAFLIGIKISDTLK